MDKSLVPRGIRNNNPLNIRVGNNWQGERKVKTDKAFEEFESMQYGVRAGLIILRKYMSGYNGLTRKFNTVDLIIRRWAPPSENKTEDYISQVCKTSGIPRHQKFTFSQKKLVVGLVDAMIRVECGQPIDTKIIESAYDML